MRGVGVEGGVPDGGLVLEIYYFPKNIVLSPHFLLSTFVTYLTGVVAGVLLVAAAVVLALFCLCQARPSSGKGGRRDETEMAAVVVSEGEDPAVLAQETATKAASADKAKRYKKARKLYTQAVELWLAAGRGAGDENSKALAAQNAETYMTRIEQLDGLIESGAGR